VWPSLRVTKADLLRYYVTMAPYVLPHVHDRPLTYRPYPRGAEAAPDRYHQRVKHAVPSGVRVEPLQGQSKQYGPRFIGGSLTTLLYIVQIGAISLDAWTSRVHSPDYPDLAVLDLDPMPDVPFQQVINVARWLKDELDEHGIPGFLKTSGATGLHVYIPLVPSTSFKDAWRFCEMLARLMAAKHPHHVTAERVIEKRGRKVYVDYLQNLPGKTMATAYSARANPHAGISTPLGWDELQDDFEPQDFTIKTIAQRLRQCGDLWAAIRTTPGIKLRHQEP
jgi:bifunctional non-homologous end joining protein LigD